MNFPLQQLEKHLPEEHLVRGEELLLTGEVHGLQEVEKNLWLARVSDDQTLETEIRISPSRVKAVSCECSVFAEQGMCSHIVASLLALRKKRQALEQKKQAKRKSKAKKTTTRLTTGMVLEDIRPEELYAFVRQYAKVNRSFALALKARFAPNVTGMESKEKYLQLLETTVSVARRPDRTITRRGTSKIVKVLKELYLQAEAHLAEGLFAEAQFISQSIIEKITPILKKVKDDPEELKAYVLEAFEWLEAIAQADVPAELRRNLLQYCYEESAKLLYRNNDLDQRFFRVLIHLVGPGEEMEALLDALDQQLERYDSEGRDPYPILLTKLRLLEGSQQQDAFRKVLEQFQSHPKILLIAIRQALRSDQVERAKKLVSIGLEKLVPPDLEHELEGLQLKIAILENEPETIRQVARRRLMQTLDLKYFTILKEIHPAESWPPLVDELVRIIRLLPYSRQKAPAIAAIYLEEERFGDLLGFLRETASLDLLKQFDQYLVKEHRGELKKLYDELLTSYLENHVGRTPSMKIRSTIEHLHQIGASGIASATVELLRSKFPERHSLMEELEIF